MISPSKGVSSCQMRPSLNQAGSCATSLYRLGINLPLDGRSVQLYVLAKEVKITGILFCLHALINVLILGTCLVASGTQNGVQCGRTNSSCISITRRAHFSRMISNEATPSS